LTKHPGIPFSPGSAEKDFKGQQFPCLLCGTGLEIRLSCKQKPYCVCNSCGVQVFFRGKTGIRRLRELLEARRLIVGPESETDRALVLFNHIQQLRGRKKILEEKQGIFFRDEALEATIRAVDKEIQGVQLELEKLAPVPR
jgi:hypothetical protein